MAYEAISAGREFAHGFAQISELGQTLYTHDRNIADYKFMQDSLMNPSSIASGFDPTLSLTSNLERILDDGNRKTLETGDTGFLMQAKDDVLSKLNVFFDGVASRKLLSVRSDGNLLKYRGDIQNSFNSSFEKALSRFNDGQIDLQKALSDRDIVNSINSVSMGDNFIDDAKTLDERENRMRLVSDRLGLLHEAIADKPEQSESFIEAVINSKNLPDTMKGRFLHGARIAKNIALREAAAEKQKIAISDEYALSNKDFNGLSDIMKTALKKGVFFDPETGVQISLYDSSVLNRNGSLNTNAAKLLSERIRQGALKQVSRLYPVSSFVRFLDSVANGSIKQQDLINMVGTPVGVTPNENKALLDAASKIKKNSLYNIIDKETGAQTFSIDKFLKEKKVTPNAWNEITSHSASMFGDVHGSDLALIALDKANIGLGDSIITFFNNSKRDNIFKKQVDAFLQDEVGKKFGYQKGKNDRNVIIKMNDSVDNPQYWLAPSTHYVGNMVSEINSMLKEFKDFSPRPNGLVQKDNLGQFVDLSKVLSGNISSSDSKEFIALYELAKAYNSLVPGSVNNFANLVESFYNNNKYLTDELVHDGVGVQFKNYKQSSYSTPPSKPDSPVAKKVQEHLKKPKTVEIDILDEPSDNPELDIQFEEEMKSFRLDKKIMKDNPELNDAILGALEKLQND